MDGALAGRSCAVPGGAAVSVTLPGRPTVAGDIASACRWVTRVLQKVDMDPDTDALLRDAIDSMRALETEAIRAWKSNAN